MNKHTIIEQKIVKHRGLTFDDVLLIPMYSDVHPSDIDLSMRITPHLFLKTPLLSIHMDTVTEDRMAIAMARNGGLGILHRNQPIQKEAEQVRNVKKEKGDEHAAVDTKGRLVCCAAIGVGDDWKERAESLVKAGADALAIDVSHAHKKNTLSVVTHLRRLFPDTDIIAGNIATEDGARALSRAGAHAVKVGIGNGTICTLRIISGVGVPQFTAILDAVKGVRGTKTTVLADGGTKNSGDMTKALGAGAHGVIAGSLFAGTDETPGAVIKLNGKTYKTYRGMGSKAALSKHSNDRYAYKTASVNSVSQGVESVVPHKGPVKDVLDQLIGGIKSGFGYVGASSIREMHTKAKFLQISSAGLRESHPFNVFVTKDEPNYKAQS